MDEKPKLLGNFEKILKFFDENSIEKLIFLICFFIFFENFLLKIEPSEIPLHHFFGFGGGGEFPPFRLATPLVGMETWQEIKKPGGKLGK